MRKHLWICMTLGLSIFIILLNASSSHATPNPKLKGTDPAASDTPMPNGVPVYLGVRTADTTVGTQIIEVVSGSPAEAAGFQVGDVITSVNGAAVSTDRPFGALLSQLSPGSTVTIVVTRANGWKALQVTLGARPAVSVSTPVAPATPPLPKVDGPASGAFLGVGLVDAGDGIRIARVAEGSAAAQAGLRVNDLIQTIDGQKIVSVGQVQALLSGKTPGQPLVITVQRGDQTLTFTVALTRRAASDPIIGGNILFPQVGFTASLNADSLRVTDVVQGSAADRAGLKVGDQIQGVNGQRLNFQNVGEAIRLLTQSGDAQLDVLRGDQTLTISITSPQTDQSLPPYAPGAARVRLGVAYEVVTTALATSNNLSVKDGALIIEVQANSPAEQAGIRVGDVVTEVDGDKVDAKHTLAVRMVAYGAGDTLTLTVVRGSDTLHLLVTLASRGVA